MNCETFPLNVLPSTLCILAGKWAFKISLNFLLLQMWETFLVHTETGKCFPANRVMFPPLTWKHFSYYRRNFSPSEGKKNAWARNIFPLLHEYLIQAIFNFFGCLSFFGQIIFNSSLFFRSQLYRNETSNDTRPPKIGPTFRPHFCLRLGMVTTHAVLPLTE